MTMNRRSLLSLCVVPLLAQLGWRDDTPRLQALADAGAPIPVGEYWLRGTLDFRGRHVDGCGSTYHLHSLIGFMCDKHTGGFHHNFIIGSAQTTGWAFAIPPEP